MEVGKTLFPVVRWTYSDVFPEEFTEMRRVGEVEVVGDLRNTLFLVL